jgi:hypothetical protein
MEGRGWFGPKTHGVGLSPKTWQGWSVVIVYAILMIGLTKWRYLPLWPKIGSLAIMTVVLGLVVRLTYRRQQS